MLEVRLFFFKCFLAQPFLAPQDNYVPLPTDQEQEARFMPSRWSLRRHDVDVVAFHVKITAKESEAVREVVPCRRNIRLEL